MSDVNEKAKSLFKEGYNCSQAVIHAFSDKFDIDLNAMLKLSSSFGGGMGRLREVCGAVSAMFMIAGLKYGYSDPNDFNAKSTHYKLIQYLANEFKKQNGSIICRELLKERETDNTLNPEKRTESYYKTRSCPDMVETAAAIVEKIMNVNSKTLVAINNGVIASKLEDATEFLVYSVSGDVIVKCETVKKSASKNISDFLSELKVDSVVAGSIEDEKSLNEKGIKTIINAAGVPYTFLKKMLSNV